jgi:hypothetical protein
MKRTLLLLTGIALAAYMYTAGACTSAIISGKVTPDGRPLLWKNRDTSNLQNCVRYMQGEKYDYVAVTGYEDYPQSIWIGTNDLGFAIMNTLSYNLVEAEGEGSSKRNGAVMKRALAVCGHVDEFRHFLDTLSRPMNVQANYGVIDAHGNASYFEVNSTTYKEYDVNDPDVAPHGFLVRSNYSFSGKLNEGAGYVRYQEAHEKLFTASAAGEVTPQWIFSNLSRSFHNPLLGIDLRDGRFNKPQATGWFVEQDFIARRSTSCAVVIQGVKDNESPMFTTMWTVIGYPPVTPAIPVWVRGAGTKLPRALTLSKDTQRCPLCDAANAVRDRVYSYHRGMNTENYFHWELLFNSSGTGYMQRAEALENELFTKLYPQLNIWRTRPSLPADVIYSLYEQVDEWLVTQGGYLLSAEEQQKSTR